MPPTQLGAVTRFKWLLFRALERLNELRARGAAPESAAAGGLPGAEPVSPSASRPVWVFASTIGELNAIGPFLRRMLAEMGAPPLVLLTDHPHYRQSFLAGYPAAEVYAVDHRSEPVAALASARHPRLLVVAEIPVGLSDAPCRFPFAVIYEARRRGVSICLVNGWRYGHAPACTMDAIEKGLFGREYLRLMDLITVQDEAARDVLVAGGADPRRVFVTGNIKYDALGMQAWNPAGAKSPALLGSIAAGGRPSIVAGSVTNISEQEVVLDAFSAVLKRVPDALLVLAPRHPEVGERMTKLKEMLAERRISGAFKTATGDAALPRSVQCLVLDTMGELRDFYAAGDVAYMGLNHNVLEPLTFGKPVVVTPGWNPAFPSYPVYRHLLAQGTISEVEPEALGDAWLALLADPAKRAGEEQAIARALESLKGATARNIELMARFELLPRNSISR